MDTQIVHFKKATDRLTKVSIMVLVVIFFLVGTYIRVRANEEIQEADFFIIIQISICFFGGILGLSLIKKQSKLQFVSKALIFYLYI